MTEPQPTSDRPSTTPGPAGPDDRRADPPPPASATSGRAVPDGEAEREMTETLRSISRLEESN